MVKNIVLKKLALFCLIEGKKNSTKQQNLTNVAIPPIKGRTYGEWHCALIQINKL